MHCKKDKKGHPCASNLSFSNTTPSKKHNPFIYSDIADSKFTYEIPEQHYFHGLLLPEEFSAEECEKAMKTKFHKDDIMLTSYPKAGKNQL